MPTKEFRPQILVGGFLHLIWLVLFAMLILGIPIDKESFNPLFKIEPGPALVLISLIAVLSFLLGELAESFVVAAIYFKKKNHDEELPKDAWAAKSFFRSVAFAVPPIVIFFISVYKFKSFVHIWAIIAIGLILEIEAILSWLCWKCKINEDKEKRRGKKEKFNKIFS